MQTVQICTKEEFIKELVSVILNNDGLVVKVSDNDNDNDEPEKTTQSAAEMRKYLH